MPVWISRFWEALRKGPPGLLIPCVDLQFLSQSAMGPLGQNFGRSGGSWRGYWKPPGDRLQAGGRLEAGWRQAGARMEPDIAVWATFSTMRLYMAFFCGEVGGQDGATRWSSRVKAQSQATGTSMQAKLTIFIIIIDVLASLDGEPCAQGGPG